MIPERQKKNKVRPVIIPDYCLERMCRLQHSKVESRQSQTDILSESPGKSNQPDFAGQVPENLSSERIPTSSDVSIQHGTEQHMHVRQLSESQERQKEPEDQK